MTVAQFRGIFPALITPLDANDRVNEPELRALVDHLIGQGVDGFFVCGGTGQGLLLTTAERKQVVAAVVEQVAGRATVIAHVGALVTAEAVDLAGHAAGAGADAVAAIPPIYYRPDLPALQDYYAAIAAAGNLPTWIYHIPHSTQVSFTPSMVQELLAIPNLSGMKYTSPDFFSMGQIIELGAERDFAVFSGLDDLCLPGLTMGAHGAIGTTYNLLAPLFVDLYRAFQAGDLAAARQRQQFANRIIRAFVNAPMLSALQYAMRYLGFECGLLRRPVRPLSPAEIEHLTAGLQAIDFFD